MPVVCIRPPAAVDIAQHRPLATALWHCEPELCASVGRLGRSVVRQLLVFYRSTGFMKCAVMRTRLPTEALEIDRKLAEAHIALARYFYAIDWKLRGRRFGSQLSIWNKRMLHQ